MSLLQRFLGSFYSPALYARLRHEERGWGIDYVLFLLAVQFTLAIIGAVISDATLRAQALSTDLLVVFTGALVMRLAMLGGLAMAAQLISLRFKPLLRYGDGFRIAAVAYTPVAIIDLAAMTFYGITPVPALFLGGLFMLLAALYVTR